MRSLDSILNLIYITPVISQIESFIQKYYKLLLSRLNIEPQKFFIDCIADILIQKYKNTTINIRFG